MEQLKRTAPITRPVKVMQFGEGNFLRAFIDWMIEKMNQQGLFDSAVQIVQPLPQGMSEQINAQDGLYHVVLRGMVNGKPQEKLELIQCVKGCLNPATQGEEIEAAACDPDLRFVFSNTTEAGIEYRPGADTFPSKIARLLTARCAAGLPGLIFIPCELIEANGSTLKECVLKYLQDKKTIDYVNNSCIFCNTLVDRIVAGYPAADAAKYCDMIGAEDKLLAAGEPFHFFVIEAPESVKKELPLQEAGLNVVFTDDQTPYRTRKVRFLNGAHTASVLAAHMAGLTFVDEMVRDKYFNKYLRTILFEEIFPTVPLPDDEKKAYAESIMERFANPFAQHRLLSIALNSVSKWKVRVLPTILDHVKIKGHLPENLTKSMASLIDFYRSCEINDSQEVKDFFAASPSVQEILANRSFWGMDLNEIPGFTEAVSKAVTK